jgi:uncharacterized protein (DUF488 family)
VANKQNQIFTIGHSNYPIEEFLALLDMHNVNVLVDVRSAPYSKYATQYNQENIRYAITNHGKKYLYLGRELGGMPKDKLLYDENDKVSYEKIAQSYSFQNAIERLKTGISKYTVALMCGEENPAGCHRRHLIGRALKDQNIEVLHIRAGGNVDSEEDLNRAEEPPARQISIQFD